MLACERCKGGEFDAYFEGVMLGAWCSCGSPFTIRAERRWNRRYEYSPGTEIDNGSGRDA